jgi:hypothetical protein
LISGAQSWRMNPEANMKDGGRFRAEHHGTHQVR